MIEKKLPENRCKICFQPIAEEAWCCSKRCATIYGLAFLRDVNKNKVMKETNGFLGKNHGILQHLCIRKDAPTEVSMDMLYMCGFNFDFYTGKSTLNGKQSVVHCYDYYYILDEGKKSARIGFTKALLDDENNKVERICVKV